MQRRRLAAISEHMESRLVLSPLLGTPVRSAFPNTDTGESGIDESDVLVAEQQPTNRFATSGSRSANSEAARSGGDHHATSPTQSTNSVSNAGRTESVASPRSQPAEANSQSQTDNNTADSGRSQNSQSDPVNTPRPPTQPSTQESRSAESTQPDVSRQSGPPTGTSSDPQETDSVTAEPGASKSSPSESVVTQPTSSDSTPAESTGGSTSDRTSTGGDEHEPVTGTESRPNEKKSDGDRRSDEATFEESESNEFTESRRSENVPADSSGITEHQSEGSVNSGTPSVSASYQDREVTPARTRSAELQPADRNDSRTGQSETTRMPQDDRDDSTSGQSRPRQDPVQQTDPEAPTRTVRPTADTRGESSDNIRPESEQREAEPEISNERQRPVGDRGTATITNRQPETEPTSDSRTSADAQTETDRRSTFIRSDSSMTDTNDSEAKVETGSTTRLRNAAIAVDTTGKLDESDVENSSSAQDAAISSEGQPDAEKPETSHLNTATGTMAETVSEGDDADKRHSLREKQAAQEVDIDSGAHVDTRDWLADIESDSAMVSYPHMFRAAESVNLNFFSPSPSAEYHASQTLFGDATRLGIMLAAINHAGRRSGSMLTFSLQDQDVRSDSSLSGSERKRRQSLFGRRRSGSSERTRLPFKTFESVDERNAISCTTESVDFVFADAATMCVLFQEREDSEDNFRRNSLFSGLLLGTAAAAACRKGKRKRTGSTQRPRAAAPRYDGDTIVF